MEVTSCQVSRLAAELDLQFEQWRARPLPLNHQIKRRTRVAGLFPNETSVPRLVTAILMEDIKWDHHMCWILWILEHPVS